MKQRSAILAILTIWLLAMCTVISFRMQDIMRIEVITVSPDQKDLLPMNVLREDEDGIHLYALAEGDAWTPGVRIFEVEHGSYTVENNNVRALTNNYRNYVQYTSRSFEVEDRARAAAKFKDAVSDTYIIRKGTEMIRQVEATRNIDFVTDAVADELGLSDDETVTSTRDLHQFYRQLPLLILIAGGIAAVIVMAVVTAVRYHQISNIRKYLIRRVVICAVITGCVVVLIFQVEIPSSLIRFNL